jgi:hypothetical protein
MTTGKSTLKLSTEELRALLDTEQTVSVTFTGPEYAELELLAEHRGLPVDQFLKALVREERDAAIDAAKAGKGK